MNTHSDNLNRSTLTCVFCLFESLSHRTSQPFLVDDLNIIILKIMVTHMSIRYCICMVNSCSRVTSVDWNGLKIILIVLKLYIMGVAIGYTVCIHRTSWWFRHRRLITIAKTIGSVMTMDDRQWWMVDELATDSLYDYVTFISIHLIWHQFRQFWWIITISSKQS